MTDPVPPLRLIDCEDCYAQAGNGARSLSVGQDGLVTETWHDADCPGYAVERILLEAAAERTERQEAWAMEAFPAAHARLQDAADRLPQDHPATSFVAALIDLVQAQADDCDRFVPLPRWSEILHRHFPSAS